MKFHCRKDKSPRNRKNARSLKRCIKKRQKSLLKDFDLSDWRSVKIKARQVCGLYTWTQGKTLVWD